MSTSNIMTWPAEKTGAKASDVTDISMAEMTGSDLLKADKASPVSARPAATQIAAKTADAPVSVPVGDSGGLPGFLDRTKGKTKAEIDASRDAAIKNASTKGSLTSAAKGGGAHKGKLPVPPPKGSTGPSVLTDKDKQAIEQIKAEQAKGVAEKTAKRINALRESKGQPPAGNAGTTAKSAGTGKSSTSTAKTSAKTKPSGAAKTAKPASPPKTESKTERKAKTARKDGDRAHYDWNGAREAAAKGKVPASPDFSANTHRSYRPALAEVEKMVKASDLTALLAYRVQGSCSSPKAIKRYREIAIIALKAKK